MAFWDGWGEEGGTWGKLDTTLIVVDDRIGIGVATNVWHVDDLLARLADAHVVLRPTDGI